jgi:HK97 family phage prohead protease
MKRTTRPPIVTALQWRDLQKKGTTAALARFAAIQKAEDGAVSFIASTQGADRYGDTIDQKGWDTASYEANPVLLWAHDYSTRPVGKVGRLDKAGDLTARDVTFTPSEMHAFGAEVGAMVAAGFLNTVSVGFLPKKWEERWDETKGFLGFHFTEMELLEISVVPVPANPQALVEGRAFAKSLTDWAHATAARSDASPIARDFSTTLEAFAKVAEEEEAKAADTTDADAFAQMLVLLERIAKSTEATQRDVAGLLQRGLTVAGKAASPEDGTHTPTITLSEALGRLLTTSR